MGCCFVFWLLGVGVLVAFLLHVLCALGQRLKSGRNLKDFGNWAVVTGSTNGIGKAIAEQLAAKKLNLILIARNKDLLASTSKEIASKYNVQVNTVVLDFGNATAEDYSRVAKEVSQVGDVGILVNNAGVSYEFPEFFLDVDIQRHRDIINVNMRAVVELTHAILPLFVKRGKGIVYNLSSVAGSLPGPLVATYGASKAFVDSFTFSLAREYKDKGIVCQSCSPGYVVTNMSKLRKATLLAPTATAFAKSAVSSMGSLPILCRPYLPHAIMFGIIDFIPCCIKNNLVYNEHINIRTRAIKKAAREAKKE